VSVPEEQPLELILARNLISIISLGAFLVDTEGTIVFFNDAAAEIFGVRFEETGRIEQPDWSNELGPLDEEGQPLPTDQLPLTIALRDGRPGYGRFHVRTDRGLIPIVAAGLPLTGSGGRHGALVAFWPLTDDQVD
jgi:PAS domain-containing protein